MATSLHGVCLSVCLVVSVVSCVTGSDIFFTASTSTILPLETEELTLRCSLKDSEVKSDANNVDVSFVHTLVISKAGVELATVSERVGPNVFDNTKGVQVTGQVPGTGLENGYLSVSWKFPDARQGGAYKCVIRGIDQQGHVMTFSQSINVAENKLSINDLVGYIHDLKVTNAALKSDLKKCNADFKAKINAINSTNTYFKSQVHKLNTNGNVMKLKMNDMKTNISDLQIQMNDLKTSNAELNTKLNTKVAFTAFVSSTAIVKDNEVAVFNKVQTKVGGGYNNSTGVFTAPVKGFFKFDIHILGQENKSVHFCIMHKGNIVARAYVDDEYG